jgi:hypothetical protein
MCFGSRTAWRVSCFLKKWGNLRFPFKDPPRFSPKRKGGFLKWLEPLILHDYRYLYVFILQYPELIPNKKPPFLFGENRFFSFFLRGVTTPEVGPSPLVFSIS